MAGNRAAIRYAKSVVELAKEKDQLDLVYGDMQVISNAIKTNREIQLLLNSPIIKVDKKQAILNKVFAAKIGELSSKLVDLLTRKGRESLLESIADQFVVQYRKLKGQVVANVTSAVPLTDSSRIKVLELIQKAVSGDIELVEDVNPDLIGGFVVRIDDKMIDASIAKKMNDLKKEMLGSSSIAIKLN
jgi:F-type H+-transporting ATPase subunit delta